jgi:hypothetical protein
VGWRINEGREKAQVGEATGELLAGGKENRKNQVREKRRHNGEETEETGRETEETGREIEGERREWVVMRVSAKRERDR